MCMQCVRLWMKIFGHHRTLLFFRSGGVLFKWHKQGLQIQPIKKGRNFKNIWWVYPCWWSLKERETATDNRMLTLSIISLYTFKLSMGKLKTLACSKIYNDTLCGLCGPLIIPPTVKWWLLGLIWLVVNLGTFSANIKLLISLIIK